MTRLNVQFINVILSHTTISAYIFYKLCKYKMQIIKVIFTCVSSAALILFSQIAPKPSKLKSITNNQSRIKFTYVICIGCWKHWPSIIVKQVHIAKIKNRNGHYWPATSSWATIRVFTKPIQCKDPPDNKKNNVLKNVLDICFYSWFYQIKQFDFAKPILNR